jgi:hypothetical protein
MVPFREGVENKGTKSLKCKLILIRFSANDLVAKSQRDKDNST